jgi:hypothetical protein
MWHRYSYCGHFRDSDGKTIVDVTRQKQVPPHSKALVLSCHSSTSVLLTVAVLPTVPLPRRNALNPSGRPLRVNRTMILRMHQNTVLSLHSCSWSFPCFEIWCCIYIQAALSIWTSLRSGGTWNQEGGSYTGDCEWWMKERSRNGASLSEGIRWGGLAGGLLYWGPWKLC